MLTNSLHRVLTGLSIIYYEMHILKIPLAILYPSLHSRSGAPFVRANHRASPLPLALHPLPSSTLSFPLMPLSSLPSNPSTPSLFYFPCLPIMLIYKKKNYMKVFPLIHSNLPSTCHLPVHTLMGLEFLKCLFIICIIPACRMMAFVLSTWLWHYYNSVNNINRWLRKTFQVTTHSGSRPSH